MTTYAEPVVLVVDNEESQILILKAMLERAGYRVKTANSGPAALDIARSLDVPLELLVTDVVMPGMSGRALAGEVRKTQTDLRVLYVTGYSDELFGEDSVLDTLEAFLEKPVTPESLLEAVRMLLRRPSAEMNAVAEVPPPPDKPAPSGGEKKSRRQRRRSHT